MRSSLSVALVAFAIACGAPATPQNRAQPVPSTDFTTEAERHDLFRSLVSDVRMHHVFAEATQKNLGRTFDDDLPALENEFTAAKTRDALLVALTHFANALHDAHCSFVVESHAQTIALDVRADVEWHDGRARFYVSRIENPNAKGLVSPGDEIRSIDGVASNDFIAHFMIVSHQNNVRSIARDVAEYLTRRKATNALTQEGNTSTWVVATQAHGDVTLTLRWSKSDDRGSFDEFAIAYDRPWCSTLSARDYGPYELTSRGMNFCIYASQVEPYKSFPIVRQFSFLYLIDGVEHAQHRVRADHDIMERELARLAPKGVLVDLRENGGGNNPNWFMDWFAGGSYVDRFVLMKLAPDLDTAEKLRDAGIGHTTEYLEALARRTPEQAFTKPLPFFCRQGSCDWDNRYTPSHRVTTVKIALLVGSRCVSACDSIAQLFAENHFGPLVGEPTAAAFTTSRMRRPIVVHGKTLGEIDFAFTRELSGVTQKPIEGVPIRIDVPIDRTFENRDRYDHMLVDAAIQAL